MASTISAGTTTTTALVYSADTSGVLQLQTNGGTTAVTIDTSQNVGIGTTPSAWSGFTVLQMANGVGLSGASGSSNTQLTSNAYFNGSAWTYIANAYATKYTQVSGQHQWFNAPSSTGAITFTQAMTLDSSGNLLVGITSSSNKFTVSTDGVRPYLFVNSSGGVGSYGFGTGAIYSNAGILTNTNPSDERLKENITDLGWGLQQILALRPVSYTWKTDTINQGKQYGFIAQEVQPVMSDLVKTFKGQDENEYFGLEKDGIYATMVKAIQELSAQVTTLQTQVTALKG